jgi:hypothetical protein
METNKYVPCGTMTQGCGMLCCSRCPPAQTRVSKKNVHMYTRMQQYARDYGTDVCKFKKNVRIYMCAHVST